MSFTYVVADLHGRFDLLEKAIKVIAAHSSGKGGTFICLGDFVDRGPDSKKIVDWLMQPSTDPLWNKIVLKGNHEEMMKLGIRKRGGNLSFWASHGGKATAKSFGVGIDTLEMGYNPTNFAAALNWIDKLPFVHWDNHRVYVHACVDSRRSLKDQEEDFCLWAFFPFPREISYPGKHIVHGHDQYEDGPKIQAGRTDLDTWAWKTGKLAIGVFDDDKPGPPVEILWAKGPPYTRYITLGE